jgi:hypothetical protein
LRVRARQEQRRILMSPRKAAIALFCLVLLAACNPTQEDPADDDPTQEDRADNVAVTTRASCSGLKAHPDADDEELPRIEKAVRALLRDKYYQGLMGVKQPQMRELIYAVHPLSDPRAVVAVFRVDSDSDPGSVFAMLFFRHGDRFVEADVSGLIPPYPGKVGSGLVTLGRSLFSLALEYGESHSEDVESVRLTEVSRPGERTDSAPICRGAFLVITGERNPESLLLEVLGADGDVLDEAKLDVGPFH